MVLLEKNMRVPADMVLLRTSEGHKSHTEDSRFKSVTESDEMEIPPIDDASKTDDSAPEQPSGGEGGTCFVRTDQLDGETDWKLRIALSRTQKMSDRELMELRGELYGAFGFAHSTILGSVVGNSTQFVTQPTHLSRTFTLSWAT
jgi:phospholipid-translocating ATPase